MIIMRDIESLSSMGQKAGTGDGPAPSAPRCADDLEPLPPGPVANNIGQTKTHLRSAQAISDDASRVVLHREPRPPNRLAG